MAADRTGLNIVNLCRSNISTKINRALLIFILKSFEKKHLNFLKDHFSED